MNASDEESRRLHRTPDSFSLTSPQDSAYGTARTVSMAPRGPEKLRMNTPEDVMEDMDETIAPSGTVDPSKVTDESDDPASFHISESNGEGFPVSRYKTGVWITYVSKVKVDPRVHPGVTRGHPVHPTHQPRCKH